MAHIANGRDPGNSVSLLRVNVSPILANIYPTHNLTLEFVVIEHTLISVKMFYRVQTQARATC